VPEGEALDPARLLAPILVESRALLLGDFVLSSGAKSHIYIDMRAILSTPRGYSLVASMLAAKILDCLGAVSDLCIAGVTTGGIAWAALTASLLHTPTGYVRTKPKTYGRGRSVEGCGNAKKIVLVDDVATTGGSLLAAAESAAREGYSVEALVAIVDRGQGAAARLREQGLRFCSLTTLKALLQEAARQNLLDREAVEKALEELAGAVDR